MCSMDGFRVVKLDTILPQIDVLITATGTYIPIHVYTVQPGPIYMYMYCRSVSVISQ